MDDLCAKEVVGEPNYRGGDVIIGDSSFNDDEGWKLVIWKKYRMKHTPQ